MIIEDGTGTGRKAGVSLSNRLSADAIQSTLMEQLNRTGGVVWALEL